MFLMCETCARYCSPQKRCHLGEEMQAGLKLRTGLCTHWDLTDVNNLFYANEGEKGMFCLDQKPELSGRSLKGVVQLEKEKFISFGLEQNRIFIRLAPGRQVTTQRPEAPHDERPKSCDERIQDQVLTASVRQIWAGN